MNKKIVAKVEEHGSAKDKIFTKFQEFNIQDMVYTLKSCKMCKKGLKCEDHELLELGKLHSKDFDAKERNDERWKTRQ